MNGLACLGKEVQRSFLVGHQAPEPPAPRFDLALGCLEPPLPSAGRCRLRHVTVVDWIERHATGPMLTQQ